MTSCGVAASVRCGRGCAKDNSKSAPMQHGEPLPYKAIAYYPSTCRPVYLAELCLMSKWDERHDPCCCPITRGSKTGGGPRINIFVVTNSSCQRNWRTTYGVGRDLVITHLRSSGPGVHASLSVRACVHVRLCACVRPRAISYQKAQGSSRRERWRRCHTDEVERNRSTAISRFLLLPVLRVGAPTKRRPRVQLFLSWWSGQG